MRIAYLTPQYPKVSHTFIRREIGGLEARGHEIVRLSIRPPEQDVVDPLDRAEQERTECVLARPWGTLVLGALGAAVRQPIAFTRASGLALRLGLRSERGLVAHLAYLFEAVFVVGFLRSRDVTHLHVHFGTNAATVALLVRTLGGPPFSMTVHGSDEFDAPRGVSLAMKVEQARFVAAVSHFTSAQLRRWVDPSHWPRVQVVHCTVADEYFDQAKPIDPDADSIVCVARIDHQKGHPVLIDAFERLVREGHRGRLVLVGDGAERAMLESRIDAAGLRDRVHVTGWVDEAKLREAVLAARALVLPSFTEGLPMVVMEALALRRPVIATYVGGIPELVRPGENGWLVPAGDTDALTDAMREALVCDVAALDAKGAAGQERVRAMHTPRTEIAKLEALFENVVGPS